MEFGIHDYINRLKRKEMWNLCLKFKDFRNQYPHNYRDINNEDLKNFLFSKFENVDLMSFQPDPDNEKYVHRFRK